MNNKQLTQRICIGIIIALAGLVILLDQLAVFPSAFNIRWYCVSIVALAMVALVIGIVNKVDLYYYIAFFLAGLYLSLTLAGNVKGISFLKTWPLILITTGLSFIIAQLINRKSKLKAIFGAVLVLVFVPILAGLWTNTWQIITPIIVLLVGVSIIAFSIIHKYHVGKTKIDNNDYRVRPSAEINNKKDTDK